MITSSFPDGQFIFGLLESHFELEWLLYAANYIIVVHVFVSNIGLSLSCWHNFKNNIIGYKFVKNNAGIIGCLQA